MEVVVLGISERRVEAHCLHVCNTLGIGNKAELIETAKYDLLP
jgi:DNA-binding CsgD family transcriptional regulator